MAKNKDKRRKDQPTGKRLPTVRPGMADAPRQRVQDRAGRAVSPAGQPEVTG